MTNKKTIIFITIFIALIAVLGVSIWGAEPEPQISDISGLRFYVHETDTKYLTNLNENEKKLELVTLIDENKLVYRLYFEIQPKQNVDKSKLRLTTDSILIELEYDQLFNQLWVDIKFNDSIIKKGVATNITLKLRSGMISKTLYLNYYDEDVQEM